jgi:hypothetical protein
MKASKKLLFLKKKQQKNFWLPGTVHLAAIRLNAATTPFAETPRRLPFLGSTARRLFLRPDLPPACRRAQDGRLVAGRGEIAKRQPAGAA